MVRIIITKTLQRQKRKNLTFRSLVIGFVQKEILCIFIIDWRIVASLINVFPSVQQQLIPPKNYAKYELLLFFQTSFMLSCELKVGECLKEGRKNGSIILKHLACDDLDGKLYLNVLLVVDFFFLPKIRCWWKFVRAMLNSTLWNGPENRLFRFDIFEKTKKGKN